MAGSRGLGQCLQRARHSAHECAAETARAAGGRDPRLHPGRNCYESLNEIWEEPIYVKDGYYSLPQEPGVGLQLKRAVVERHRIG